jgi:hypothetical protein
VGLTNLGSESETCVGSCVYLVGVSISFEKNFYRLPFTPPLSGSPYRSFRVEKTRWSHIPITFSEEDVRLQGFPRNDALVIEANIASWTLGKLLVDNGSSADIIFADAFDKMGLN